MNYPISDMIIRIKNAQLVHAENVVMPFSRLRWQIANILKTAGYIGEVEKKSKKSRKSELDYIDIVLKYDGVHPVISGINLISRPSRHLYIKAKDIKPVRSGYGVAIISTSRGIMTSKEARKQKLGGEILFEIY